MTGEISDEKVEGATNKMLISCTEKISAPVASYYILCK